MNPLVRDDLLSAARTLRRSGWCQRKYFDPQTGGRCAVGAIEASARFRSCLACVRLSEHLGIDVNQLSSWNDAPGRTADEVIAAMEAAAHTEES